LALAAPAAAAHADVALEAARRARSLALELGRQIDAGRAGVWACAHLLRLGRYEELLREAAIGRPLVARDGLQAEHRELLRLLSLAGSEAGNFEAALKAAQELVALSADAGDDAALTAALALAVCFERMGDSWQAMRILEEVLREHGSAGAAAPEPVLLPLLMASNGLCATALGIAHRLLDLDDADELRDVLALARLAGERSSELLSRMPDPVYRVAVMGNLGEVLMYQGDTESAAPLVHGAYEQARRLGLRAYAWRIQATLGALQVARGEPLQAMLSMRDLVAEMGDQAPPQTLVRTHHVPTAPALRWAAAKRRCTTSRTPSASSGAAPWRNCARNRRCSSRAPRPSMPSGRPSRPGVRRRSSVNARWPPPSTPSVTRSPAWATAATC
jgi:tetratricopeptide (TPR) repeat protein